MKGIVGGMKFEKGRNQIKISTLSITNTPPSDSNLAVVSHASLLVMASKVSLLLSRWGGADSHKDTFLDFKGDKGLVDS